MCSLRTKTPRAALAAVFRLSGDLGAHLCRYLALFRPAQRELTMERVARILKEVVEALQAEKIERGGKLYDAPPEAWIWAIRQTLDARAAGRLKTPLTGHGWLYEVLSNWTPTVPATQSAAAPTQTTARPASATAAAIAALQERVP